MLFVIVLNTLSFCALLRANSISDHQCGVKLVASGLVVNGSETTLNEWPWLASLMTFPEKKFLCGGTLISENRVITAAHCIQNKRSVEARKPTEVLVSLGKHNLDKEEANSKSFVPKEILIHPHWSSDSERFDADLAVLISDVAILFSSQIFPVCLWTFAVDNDNEEGTVVGWGGSERTHLIGTEKTPRQVQVKRVPATKCYEDFHHLAAISTNRTFCAGGATVLSGPCLGDSGGGFYVAIDDVWYLQGVVSASFLNAQKNCDLTKYGIYTKIYEFRDWLKHESKVFNVELHCMFTQDPSTNVMKCSTLDLMVLQPFTSLIMANNQTGAEINTLEVIKQTVRHFPLSLGILLPQLDTLILTDSKLRFFERRSFENMPKLKKLDLSRNDIEAIPRDAFFDLKKLQRIFVQSNKLKKIHEDTFTKNPKLMKFEATFNQIESLQPDQFRQNQKLKEIDFRYNEIKSISREHFAGLANLKQLLLDENLIKTIRVDVFQDLTNIEHISISRNRLSGLSPETFDHNVNLEKFNAGDNRIRSLPRGLFKNNIHLVWMKFERNQIYSIKMRFNKDHKYEMLDFSYNTCIDTMFHATDNLVSFESFVNSLYEKFREKAKANNFQYYLML